MTFEELRVFLNDLPDRELNAAITIAETILKARRRARPLPPGIAAAFEKAKARRAAGLDGPYPIHVCPPWEDQVNDGREVT